jgi:SNF2 family DNA or RNA helicase
MLMLSATAIESPLKMWALGYILGFHNLKDFYRWSFKNGVVRNYGFPGFHFNGKTSILENIHSHIFPEWGSRMRKALIPDFPECQTVLELIDTSEGADSSLLSSWYQEIAKREQESIDKAEDEESPFNLGSVLPELLFARMRAELSKVPALIEMAKDGLAEGNSVVIFVNFLGTMQALRKLGFPAAGLISGEQKITERTAIIKEFQRDDSRVIISTIDSGGAGISLHDVTGRHPRLALLCPTWRATTLRQALGRVHRAGGQTKTLQKLIYASGTVEERVAERVREKLGQIDLINDSDLAEPEFAGV